MSATTVDLTQSALDWLLAPDAVAAFRAWLPAQDPLVQAGFGSLGVRFDSPDLDRQIARVARHRDAIREAVRQGPWRRPIEAGLRHAFTSLNMPGPSVRLFVLVGTGSSNSSATSWRGTGAIFVWLEHWLGRNATDGTLQDLSIEFLESSVVHEFAHAMRYTLPGSRSDFASMSPQTPSDLWSARRAVPLREHLFDEGLATHFAKASVPGLSEPAALLLGRDAVEWLGRHWATLAANRERTWDFDAPNPEAGWMREALFFDRERARPPWTLERPPAKWGYYVGLKWSELRAGDWSERLSASATDWREGGRGGET